MSPLKSFLSGVDYICPVLGCQNSFQVRPGHGSFKWVDVQQNRVESGPEQKNRRHIKKKKPNCV